MHLVPSDYDNSFCLIPNRNLQAEMKKIPVILAPVALLGMLDAGYLTYEHYAHILPPCTTNAIIDCGQVLTSKYSIVLGIPLALVGLTYYLVLFCMSLSLFSKDSEKVRKGIVLFTASGFLFSLYFLYLQIFVIHAICLYCMASAFTSTFLFLITQILLKDESKELKIDALSLSYKYIVKKILFLFDAENVHNSMTFIGELLGKSKFARGIFAYLFVVKNKALRQKILGIDFNNPIGLAAGFDYEARLSNILPSVGFGFQTIGTVTNYPYAGNPKPLLGRLPKSKSLMVNKGFKSPGANSIIEKLAKSKFTFPVGISIGRTNGRDMTQKESVQDIIYAFKKFEKSQVKNSYYELNISCPNLIGNISFYPPKNLEELLRETDKLHLRKPLFIKMPIEKSDREVLGMLKIIAKHKVKGVIFGNLQKDRNHPSLHKSEVLKFDVGHFSGKPTFDRSNELIALAYKNYKKRFVIIGCGGVFSAQDAYLKIKLGASIVQLITGMIFVGPQLISQINRGLIKLLEADGYRHISEAIGTQNIP